MSDDSATGVSQVFVAAGVIAVEMSVDQKGRSAATKLFHLRQDCLGQRGELVVDHEGAVFADQHADVAAFTGQHMDGIAYLDAIDLLCSGGSGECQRRQGANQWNKAHRLVLDMGDCFTLDHNPPAHH
nr:hypothetical protein [Pistricoccus aurantiacus]